MRDTVGESLNRPRQHPGRLLVPMQLLSLMCPERLGIRDRMGLDFVLRVERFWRHLAKGAHSFGALGCKLSNLHILRPLYTAVVEHQKKSNCDGCSLKLEC